MKNLVVVFAVIAGIVALYLFTREPTVEIDDPAGTLLEICDGLVGVVKSHSGDCDVTDEKLHAYIEIHIAKIKEIDRRIDLMQSREEIAAFEERIMGKLANYVGPLEEYTRECPKFRKGIMQLVQQFNKVKK